MQFRLLEKIVDEIEKTSEKVVGNTINVGERKLIPIIEKTYFSVNKGKSTSPRNPKILAFRVKPIAFIVVEDHRQTVLPIEEEKITISWLLDEIPELAGKIREAKDDKKS